LVGKHEFKRSQGRIKPTWTDNTKLGLEGIKFENVDWTQLAQVTDQWQAYVETKILIIY
jgi:hypothetical protein